MEHENAIQDSLNQAGRLATGLCLQDFDSDGSPIIFAGQKLTAKKDPVPKKYETPFGVVPVNRFVYQSSLGGATFIPMDANARIVGASTPRFAKIVSFNYAHNNAGVVQSNLEQILNRKVSRCYIQDVSGLAAQQISQKAPYWEYEQSEPKVQEVAFITIGIDGTCLHYVKEGFRHAMVGTIAFYDKEGERLHTTYIASAPEYGKATFLTKMDEEIGRIKQKYQEVGYIGISDGARDYLPWLKKHTSTQILDFWHVCEYINEVAPALHRNKKQREEWIEESCHKLKHEAGAAKQILEELEKEAEKKPAKGKKEKLERTITYIKNNLKRMNYASYRKRKLPIGSGVTEAACKTVVKIRMCGSGMSWKEKGAERVLTLRSLALTKARWEEFWTKLMKYGLSSQK